MKKVITLLAMSGVLAFACSDTNETTTPVTGTDAGTDSSTADVVAVPDGETVDPLVADLVGLKTATEILTATFKELTRHKPTFAVFGSDGDRSMDALMDSVSATEFRKFYVRMAYLGKKLDGIDVKTLVGKELLAYDISRSAVADANSRAAAKFETWEMNFMYDEGDDLPYYSAVGPIRNRADFDNLVTRYKQIPTYFDDKIANYKIGLADKRVAPAALINRVIEKNQALYSATVVAENPFLQNLTFDAAVSASDKAAWTTEIQPIIMNTVNPAGLKWVKFLKDELLPAASTTNFGLAGFTGGKALYAGQVQFYTGDERSPAALHALGQQRVTALETQLKAALTELGINAATIPAGITAAKALPGAQPATATAIKTYVNSTLIPSLSASTWATDVWGITAPPAVTIDFPDATGTALYQSGVKKIRIPTQGLPRPSLDSVLVHEYTHYLQELTNSANVPFSPVQQFFGSSAMTEGAALYSEQVALDSAFYKNGTTQEKSLAKMFAVNNMMLRAVRLVVDTGLNSEGWTRQQAIDYMTAHLADSAGSISFEVDRYAAIPGQALAYRLGLEAIIDSETKAKTALGAKYDAKKFHTRVLGLLGGGAKIIAISTDQFIASGGL